MLNGKILAAVFCFCALMLLIAIIMTISTKPGTIPNDYEWDLPNDEVLKYAEKFKGK